MSDITTIAVSYGGAQPVNVDAYEAIQASRGGRQRTGGGGQFIIAGSLATAIIGSSFDAEMPANGILVLSPATIAALSAQGITQTPGTNRLVSAGVTA
jgi:hypothetical protein